MILSPEEKKKRKLPLLFKAPGTASGYFVWPLLPLVIRHANCARKETFQALTDVNSCIFFIGIILTSKPK